MSERLGQTRQNTFVMVAGNGTDSLRPATPLKNSIQAYLLHIVRLNLDPAIRLVDKSIVNPSPSAYAQPQ